MTQMNTAILIIGGCRSGKSRQALKLAKPMRGRQNIFVATCSPQDDEMTARVEQHRKERGDDWQSVEAPLDPTAAIQDSGPQADILVIDCLTLWVSNLLMAGFDDHQVFEKIDRMCTILHAPPCPVILVSNEVGTGIVPENALARRFRDLAGWCNQRVAAACEQVIWMVAGIAVYVKPQLSID
jgi:adenosylcobinamide kinase / adenosylcobinamide-phosphate guanylyltransferase